MTDLLQTISAGPVDGLAPGDVLVLRDDPALDGRRIAVFNADGELFAVDDRCTHQEASLADGFLEGCEVECPLHASAFDLRTGVPSGPPATKPIRTYPVAVADGTILIRIPAQGQA